jgi:hypothetical protein
MSQLTHLLKPMPHAVLDYALVALLALAPLLFGFSGAPATICWILAAVQLGMSLLTAYPLGIARVIPFPVHGGVEALTAPFLVVAPWIFRFSEVTAAKAFFIASGILLAAVWLVTDYRAAERPRAEVPMGASRVPVR